MPLMTGFGGEFLYAEGLPKKGENNDHFCKGGEEHNGKGEKRHPGKDRYFLYKGGLLDLLCFEQLFL